MTSQPAEIRGTVEHGAEGTLVQGTSREDQDLIARLKAQGFRWSRRLEAWYLPRNWTEPTRSQRVRALIGHLGTSIEVIAASAPRSGAAEREHETRNRAADRAQRMEERAVKLAEKAEAAASRARQMQSHIPLGQPVLMGHHSQRRHERDLERIDRNLRQAAQEHERATEAAEAATRAHAVAQGVESTVTIGNKLDRLEAEQCKVLRRLEGTGKTIHGEDTPAEGTYRRQLEERVVELDDQISHNQAKIAAAGGVPHSRETVTAGDLVQIRGRWYPVTRANVKTVTVPGGLYTGQSETAPWREVQRHLPRGQTTQAQARALATGTSQAFPVLRARLEQYAAELEAPDAM